MANLVAASQLGNLRSSCNQLRESVNKLSNSLMREKNALAAANNSIGLVLLDAVGILVPVEGGMQDRIVLERLGAAYVNAVNQFGD